jgi:uncharacterized protein YbjT (DUF2867 family)
VRVILFGATGMVGQGVLRECILDPEVTAVVSVVRRLTAPSLGRSSDKVTEVVTSNLSNLSAIAGELTGYDACLFCVGVSALGMKQAEYRRQTFDLTTAAARTVLRVNPTTSSSGTTFVYVSGAGTNANGRAMWARVKGETEDWLLSMSFQAAYIFRPAMIVPQHGITSKTRLYRIIYAAIKPILPMLLRLFPKHVTTTDHLGRAMLVVAKHGYAKPVLEAEDIARV